MMIIKFSRSNYHKDNCSFQRTIMKKMINFWPNSGKVFEAHLKSWARKIEVCKLQNTRIMKVNNSGRKTENIAQMLTWRIRIASRGLREIRDSMSQVTSRQGWARPVVKCISGTISKATEMKNMIMFSMVKGGCVTKKLPQIASTACFTKACPIFVPSTIPMSLLHQVCSATAKKRNRKLKLNAKVWIKCLQHVRRRLSPVYTQTAELCPKVAKETDSINILELPAKFKRKTKCSSWVRTLTHNQRNSIEVAKQGKRETLRSNSTIWRKTVLKVWTLLLI